MLADRAADHVKISGFRARFDRTVVRPEKHYSLSARSKLWHANWEMFKEHPVIGIGYNNNERKAQEYVDRLYPENIDDNFYGHAHSTPLQILATTGLLGFAIYLLLWFAVFRKTVTLAFQPIMCREKWLGIGLLAGFIGFHVQGITQWNFGDAEVLHNLMFIWALLATLPEPETPHQLRQV